MCRFVYYQGTPIRIGELLTEPEHSLIHQSFHSHERDEPLNGDGFGVAWHADGDSTPALFRSVSPAWSNGNLADLAQVTASGRILAHIRAATAGTVVAEVNCHPFRYVNCALTDGEVAVVCRFTTDAPDNADSLYVHQGMRYTCVEGASALVHCPEARTSVLASSEPLTPGDHWDPVPVGGMLLVGKDQEVRGRPLRFA